MVGDVGYVDKTYPSLYLPDRLWLARSKRDANTDMRWLTHFLASEPGAALLRGLASGTSMSMQSIPKDRVLALEIKAPDANEQRAIGDALEDVQHLVISLERLVMKKQEIKQGLSQELLAGRTRLPGFIGERRPVRLSAEGGTYGGLTGKVRSDFGTGAAHYVTFTEVLSSARLLGRRLGQVKVHSGERQICVRRGDVLFNGSSETPEEVALSAVVDFDPSPTTYLNSFCFGYRLQSRDRIDPAYLAYYFRSAAGREIVSVLAQGATRYNIAKTKLMQAEPSFPPPDEQRAIVGVLRDAEAELELLIARLQKARAVQQGMMQQLLTGRVRLPAEATT